MSTRGITIAVDKASGPDKSAVVIGEFDDVGGEFRVLGVHDIPMNDVDFLPELVGKSGWEGFVMPRWFGRRTYPNKNRKGGQGPQKGKNK